MYYHEKRRSCGSLLPNIYFLLQLIIILLSLLLIMQIIQALNLSMFVFVLSIIIGAGFFVSFIIDRKRIIFRQDYHCKIH